MVVFAAKWKEQNTNAPRTGSDCERESANEKGQAEVMANQRPICERESANEKEPSTNHLCGSMQAANCGLHASADKNGHNRSPLPLERQDFCRDGRRPSGALPPLQKTGARGWGSFGVVVGVCGGQSDSLCLAVSATNLHQIW